MFLVIITAVLSCCYAQLAPSQTYPYNRQLDSTGNVQLYWNFDTTHITFELIVNTVGWIGLGVSPGGAMTGADIYVGWVKDGQGHITDRYAGSNTFPPLDTESNVELLSSAECDGWTRIQFKRQLPRCETAHDLAITGDTMRMIWAFGTTDPTGNDITSSNYHATNKGGKSLILLGEGSTAATPTEELQSYDVTVGQFTIPAQKTYYSCHLVQLPSLTSKLHVVKISPIVQAGNELYVHHMLVYQCVDPLPGGAKVGGNGQCYTSSAPVSGSSCEYVIASWAIGGGDFVFPNDVGFPLGEADSPKNVVLEMHYDNPSSTSGVVDSSGLRFHYTSQVRSFDAGIMQVGEIVSPYSHVIPPGASSFITNGDCTSQCLSTAMAASNATQINVFGVLLHTHLLGRKLALKHVRSAVEKAPIAKDDGYDFNFQSFRYLNPQRAVESGDSLRMMCDYSSADKTTITYGGLSTDREMCLAFIVYYPKLKISNCESSPQINKLIAAFGLGSQQITWPASTGAYGDFSNVIISGGQTVEAYLNEKTWDASALTALSANLSTMPRNQKCNGVGYSPSVTNPVNPISITTPYVEPVVSCASPTTGFNLSSASLFTCPTPNPSTTAGTDTTSAAGRMEYNLMLLAFGAAIVFVLDTVRELF